MKRLLGVALLVGCHSSAPAHVEVDAAIASASPKSSSPSEPVDTDAGWTFPQERSVASAFTMSTAQGSDDYLLVRDGTTLHLLHRETDDGRCDEGKQGPLDICQGDEYSRVADIGIGTSDLAEVIDVAEKPLDCLARQDGLRLIFR